MPTLRTAIYGLVVVLTGVALALSLARPDMGTPAYPMSALTWGDSLTPTDAAHSRAAADSLAEEIVIANAFSPTRSAPARRYTPAEMTTDTAAGAVAEPPAAGDSLALSAAFEPILFGTIAGDSSTASRALLQLQPFAPSPRLYEVGERAGGYRVVTISPREVVLSGPHGRLVLRLPQEEERP